MSEAGSGHATTRRPKMEHKDAYDLDRIPFYYSVSPQATYAAWQYFQGEGLTAS